MQEVTIQIKITSCSQCPFFTKGNRTSTDGFDSGEDWLCKKAKKVIEGFVEWHEESKVKIPNWCPAKI